MSSRRWPCPSDRCYFYEKLADSSSIPKFVSDAGILSPPKSARHLADIMLNLLDASSERDRLITRKRDRHKQFSWDQTAAQTVAVYRSLL
jgi:glycosyltransferase involved in cell wall biosynthesis